MNTIGASHHPITADLPAWHYTPPPEPAHDFLVPNPRTDLAATPAPQPAPRRTPRREIEPDSIFWSPVAHADDAA